MKIKMLVDNRVSFAKGSVLEVDEREAKRLLSLGFAEKVAEVKKVVVEEKPRERSLLGPKRKKRNNQCLRK